MGGGFPAAAFGGRADVMAHLAPEGPVYQAGTLSGNPIATTAGLTTLRLATDEVYARLDEAAQGVREAAGPRWPRKVCRTSCRRPGTCSASSSPTRAYRGADFAGAGAQGTGALRGVLPCDARPRRLPAAECVRSVVRRRGPRRPGARPDRAPPCPAAAARRRAVEPKASPMSDRTDACTCCATARCTTRRRPVRPAARLPPVRARPAGWPSGSRTGRRPRRHRTSSPPRWSGPRRPPAPAPLACGVDGGHDARVIEATNIFEGLRFGVGDGIVKRRASGGTCGTRSGPPGVSPTRTWSGAWSQPCTTPGRRPAATRRWWSHASCRSGSSGSRVGRGRPRLHDRRRRQCGLASLTSLVFDGDGADGAGLRRASSANLITSRTGPESAGAPRRGGWLYPCVRLSAPYPLALGSGPPPCSRWPDAPTTGAAPANQGFVAGDGRSRRFRRPPTASRPGRWGGDPGRRQLVARRLPGQDRGDQRLRVLVSAVPVRGADLGAGSRDLAGKGSRTSGSNSRDRARTRPTRSCRRIDVPVASRRPGRADAPGVARRAHSELRAEHRRPRPPGPGRRQRAGQDLPGDDARRLRRGRGPGGGAGRRSRGPDWFATRSRLTARWCWRCRSRSSPGWCRSSRPCVIPLLPGYLSYATGLTGADLENGRRDRMLIGIDALRARLLRRVRDARDAVRRPGGLVGRHRRQLSVVPRHLRDPARPGLHGLVPWLQRDVRGAQGAGGRAGRGAAARLAVRGSAGRRASARPCRRCRRLALRRGDRHRGARC